MRWIEACDDLSWIPDTANNRTPLQAPRSPLDTDEKVAARQTYADLNDQIMSTMVDTCYSPKRISLRSGTEDTSLW